jgi:hypothetical protein
VPRHASSAWSDDASGGPDLPATICRSVRQSAARSGGPLYAYDGPPRAQRVCRTLRQLVVCVRRPAVRSDSRPHAPANRFTRTTVRRTLRQSVASVRRLAVRSGNSPHAPAVCRTLRQLVESVRRLVARPVTPPHAYDGVTSVPSACRMHQKSESAEEDWSIVHNGTGPTGRESLARG